MGFMSQEPLEILFKSRCLFFSGEVHSIFSKRSMNQHRLRTIGIGQAEGMHTFIGALFSQLGYK